MEDEAIVSLYLARDDTAVRHTQMKYGTRLRLLAMNILSDFPSAEECENDTYLQAWNLIPPHEPRTYLFAFLARITRHLSLDRCRKRTAQKRNALVLTLSDELGECIPSSEDVVSALEARELEKILNAFLHSLPKKQRIVFLRRYWYMDSLESIGKRCGLSVGTVKSILHRIRGKLRVFLEKEGYR